MRIMSSTRIKMCVRNRARWDTTHKEIPLRASLARATFGGGSRYPQSVSSSGSERYSVFDLCDLTRLCPQYRSFLPGALLESDRWVQGHFHVWWCPVGAWRFFSRRRSLCQVAKRPTQQVHNPDV